LIEATCTANTVLVLGEALTELMKTDGGRVVVDQIVRVCVGGVKKVVDVEFIVLVVLVNE
jgi:hypothetical protein